MSDLADSLIRCTRCGGVVDECPEMFVPLSMDEQGRAIEEALCEACRLKATDTRRNDGQATEAQGDA